MAEKRAHKIADTMALEDWRPFALEVTRQITENEQRIINLHEQVLSFAQDIKGTLRVHLTIGLSVFAMFGAFILWHVNQPAHFEAGQVYANSQARIGSLEQREQAISKSIEDLQKRVAQIEGK